MHLLPPDIATLVDSAADHHGISRELARAVAWIESNGKQSATSPVGARGVMQLMPNTAKGLGVDIDDTAQNIEGGVRFLARLVRNFGERPGLAAYNWGPGAAGSSHRARLLAGDWPPSVQGYVDKVQKRAALEALPGGPFSTTPPSQLGRIELQKHAQPMAAAEPTRSSRALQSLELSLSCESDDQ